MIQQATKCVQHPAVFQLQQYRLPLIALIACITMLVGSAHAGEPHYETATLAGGCFWCNEADLEKAPGVLGAISGFAGGKEMNPSYQQVASGDTSHIESVQVTYDPALITYDELLEYFWRNIDPTDDGGQFVDRGPQYRPAIFYHSPSQKASAEFGLKTLAEKFDKPIKVELIPYTAFYPAEEYHQDYYKKSWLKYSFYRKRSGRDAFIARHWSAPPAHALEFKKPSPEVLKSKIGELAFRVTQEDETEKPFDNPYNDNKTPGIYVDIVSGEPLFSSTHKYDSGTGWPSFTQPIEPAYIQEKQDYTLIFPRTEVRSRIADSHLGHVFDDGPQPNGLRYCINSAALRFIPKYKMAEEGYANYLPLFELLE